MIPRYTRPELGSLWSDQARMDTWRQVEVAATEELADLLGPGKGPTAAELEAIRRCVARGQPFGDPSWAETCARQLQLEFTLRPRGRPRVRN